MPRIFLLLGSVVLWMYTFTAPSAAHNVDPAVLEKAQYATVAILRNAVPVFDGLSAVHMAFDIRGTGVHRGGGYIVTSLHAVQVNENGIEDIIPRSITILTATLGQLTAVLVGQNDDADLAVYRVNDEDRIHLSGAASFADNESLVGTSVFMVGYPMNWGSTITFGHVIDTMHYFPTVKSRVIRMHLDSCSGNSGGGVFNERGNMLGIAHAIIQTEHVQGHGGCGHIVSVIPAIIVQRTVQDILEGREPKFPKIGIEMTMVFMKKHWSVAVVKSTGPAHDAGVRQGDIILSINDQPMFTPSDVANFIFEKAVPGETLSFNILRGGKALVLSVKIASP